MVPTVRNRIRPVRNFFLAYRVRFVLCNTGLLRIRNLTFYNLLILLIAKCWLTVHETTECSDIDYYR